MVYTRWCGVRKIIQLAAERIQPSNRLVPFLGQKFRCQRKGFGIGSESRLSPDSTAGVGLIWAWQCL